ncbi:MAG: hypothetical protein R6U22_10420, partial [Desulfohalobiaceae bacterium]
GTNPHIVESPQAWKDWILDFSRMTEGDMPKVVALRPPDIGYTPDVIPDYDPGSRQNGAKRQN